MSGAIGGIEEQYVRWSDFLVRIDPGGGDVAARVEQYRQEWGVPLDFRAGSSFRLVGLEFPAFEWDRPGSFRETGFSAYLDEGVDCGSMLTTFVKKIPLLDVEGVYSADEVHEIDESGETIRRWRVPRDYTIRGVSGGELLIPYRLYPPCESTTAASGFPIWVDLAILPNGSFRVVPAYEAAPRPDRYECRKVPPEFSDSDYEKCETFRDLRTGESRRIVSEYPCT